MGPTWTGVLVGVGVPVLVFFPAAVWGSLWRVVDEHGAYVLLPAFTLLMAPGAVAGLLAARWAASRRDAWRFCGGLFLGGSIVGCGLLWLGAWDLEWGRRVVHATFGGALLGGFWLWIGGLLGLTAAYARRAREEENAPEPPPTGDRV